MLLNDLPFSDLYLGSNDSWLKNNAKIFPIPSEVSTEIETLKALCDKEYEDSGEPEFFIHYSELKYRVSLLDSISDNVYVLRRFLKKVPELDSLGLHPSYVEKLLSEGVSGMIVVCGKYGSGKTTTLSSVLAGRLHKVGGVAVTVEDPVEMPLEGQYGDGVCYQVAVKRGDFSSPARQAARWSPDMLFFGEIRDDETAREALKASTNGILVLATIHSDGISGALERLYTYAVGDLSFSGEDVSSLMSNGITCVVHQNLIGDSNKRLETEFLWIGADKDSPGIRSKINSKSWGQITEDVRRQQNKLTVAAYAAKPEV